MLPIVTELTTRIDDVPSVVGAAVLDRSVPGADGPGRRGGEVHPGRELSHGLAPIRRAAEEKDVERDRSGSGGDHHEGPEKQRSQTVGIHADNASSASDRRNAAASAGLFA